MARLRPVDPLAPPARHRQPIRKNEGVAMTVDQFGEDAWAMVRGGDVSEESSATSSHAVEAIIKQDEPEEPVAVPTPIGCWKVISPEGRAERVFRPIPGFEHLCNGPKQPQGVPRLVDSPRAVATPVHQPVIAQVPAASRQDQTKKRKRARPRVRERPCRTITRQYSEEEDDERYDDNDLTVPTVKSHTFYIGDVEELKRFFRRRLDELTMKPVRPIVTAWVKLLEPKRLTRFGPYHKKLPRELPPECTPPWWPQDVPYEEPSHLDKAGLLTLAVDLMLQHRAIDVAKRSLGWAKKLEKAAYYAVETTPPDQFSSSKGSAFSERMQQRALDEILPNLFDIVLSYESHFAMYDLYEGTNNRDPGNGTRVTWQHLMRPPRQPSVPRKRYRRTKTTPPPRIASDADGSGDETEVDNTTTESHLRHGEDVGQPQQEAQAPVGGHTIPQPHIHPQSCVTTPNSSFGKSMHALQLGDNSDLDVKVVSHAPYHDQGLSQNNFHCSQPMQFCTGHPGYHPVLQHQQGVGSSGVVPVSAAAYDEPFSMFPTYDSPAESAAFANDAGFPYEYDIFARHSSTVYQA